MRNGPPTTRVSERREECREERSEETLYRCTGCGAWLPRGWFKSDGRGGLSRRCRACRQPVHKGGQKRRRERMKRQGPRTPNEVITAEFIRALLVKQHFECACGCGRNIGLGRMFHVDHRVALVNGGRHVRDNVQLLAPRCNLVKGRKPPGD